MIITESTVKYSGTGAVMILFYLAVLQPPARKNLQDSSPVMFARTLLDYTGE